MDSIAIRRQSVVLAVLTIDLDTVTAIDLAVVRESGIGFKCYALITSYDSSPYLCFATFTVVLCIVICLC
jgi:hypothetical protein